MTSFIDAVKVIEPLIRYEKVSDVARADQAEAATRDAQRILEDGKEWTQVLEPGRSFTMTEMENGSPGERTRDAIVIACLGIVGVHFCQHAKDSGTVRMLNLENRSCLCSRCLIGRTGRRTGRELAEDQCEFCLERGHETFGPIAIRSSGLMVAGNACTDCWEFITGYFKFGARS